MYMYTAADLAEKLGTRREGEAPVERVTAPTIPAQTKSAVGQLQQYLLGTSYIKVFSVEGAQGQKDQDAVWLAPPLHARASARGPQALIAGPALNVLESRHWRRISTMLALIRSTLWHGPTEHAAPLRARAAGAADVEEQDECKAAGLLPLLEPAQQHKRPGAVQRGRVQDRSECRSAAQGLGLDAA